MRAQLHKQERIFVLEKDLGNICVPLRRDVLRLEPVEQRHVPALRELNLERGDKTGDTRFAADLAAGFRGMVGFVGEELVSCYWWADGSMPEHRDMRRLGLDIELAEGNAYGFDFYVHKGHRAGGAAADVLYQVETALREQGFERLWGYVVADNRMARWMYDARGYQARWMVVRTRILRRWRNRIAPIERREQVSV